MNHVERLFKVGLRNYTRYIGLACSLGECYNADPIPPQCTEKLSRDARYMLHVLAHDGDGCQVVFHHDLVNTPHGDLMRELFGKYLLGKRGVLCSHPNGGTVLGGSL